MVFENFIGPAYTSLSRQAAGDRCVNLYLETVEVASEKANKVLYSTPGTVPFSTLPQAPVKALFAENGRVFAVGGNTLYEIGSGGAATSIAFLSTPPDQPVRMVSNGYQILISSGEKRWIFEGGNVTPVNVSSEPISGIAMLDNYFIASEFGTRRFSISELNDGKTWQADQVGVKEGAGDNIVTILADHRELWVLGERTSEVWYNSGNADFPFERIQGAFLEAGCAAARSVFRFDNSIAWIGADERGQGIAWRANGYTPMRVSTHAVEAALASYPRIDDAIGFSYQEKGHTFAVWTFPTADKTWVFDAAVGAWHEREWFDSINGLPHAIRGRCYCFGHGRHLVGDWENGKIYSLGGNSDDGGPIRRIRRAPHLSSEQRVMRHARFQIDMETGENVPQDADPLAVLRTSNDGGTTWSNEMERKIGRVGHYGRRVIWNRLGASRDRVYEVTITDSVPVSLINAYINVSPGVA